MGLDDLTERDGPCVVEDVQEWDSCSTTLSALLRRDVALAWRRLDLVLSREHAGRSGDAYVCMLYDLGSGTVRGAFGEDDYPGDAHGDLRQAIRKFLVELDEPERYVPFLPILVSMLQPGAFNRH